MVFQFRQDRQNRRALRLTNPLLGRRPVAAKPRSEVDAGCRGFLIVFYEIRPVLPDGCGEPSIAGKGRVLLPARGKQAEAADRERFDERFLQPLGGRLRLRRGRPAVAQDVPELVAELVGELAPVERADIDNDPRRFRRGGVQPDCWRPRGMITARRGNASRTESGLQARSPLFCFCD